ncbi:hypothetical protein [Limnobaculum xujianqingii]|uniref:hypothetical protein n=1 Tax=Limnobaculum xujianqingii TaxID=2738837 RepID=UPI001126F268|nr:hypothetical protein [Limnobaculum xujianqingii]
MDDSEMKRYVCVLVCTVLLVGCSASPTYENFAKTMDSWVGKSLDRYVDARGYPDGSMTAPNGNKVYYYYHRWSHYSSGMAVQSGTMTLSTPASTYIQACDIFVEIDEQQIIVKWSSKGKCVKREIELAE